MTENSFTTVRRIAQVVETGKKLEDALRVVISAAHGRKADDVEKASQLVENSLLKNNKLTDLLRTASESQVERELYLDAKTGRA